MMRLATALGIGVLFVLPAWSQTPTGDLPAQPQGTEDIRKPQEANAKLFKDLTRKLLELAVKLDKSDKPEDKDRAKTIRAALEVAEKAGVENQFRALLGGMSGGSRQLQDIEKLIGQDEELTKTLLEMLTILMTDDETARLKAEIARLEKFLKEAEELKRRQELLRTKTDTNKGNPKEIAESQKDLAGQTKDLANRMGGNKSADGNSLPETKSEPKASDAKDGERASDSKSDSEGPKSDSKDGDEKAGSESKAKTGNEPKESRSSESPDGEAKPANSNGAKPGEPSTSKSQGQGKGVAKPSQGQPGEAKGKGGKPDDSQSSSSSSKGGGQSGSGQPQPSQPQTPQNQVPGRKNVEEAYPHQKGAEEDANKDKRPDASKKMDKAVEELAKAIEEMKKRLKQLREEELLKLLANLEARCNRMLAMQIDVYENTKSIHAGIVKNNNEKINADIQKSQQQADKEKEIIAEAEKTLKLLETEGSAVAFATVLQEVMGDMQAVQARLEKAYVDLDTQAIEENIIQMLRDMVAALKRQQQEMQNNRNNPNNNSGKPNQKLIDQLAELKLIRALQSQVNSRTTMYGKKFEGEQASDTLIQSELKQLAQRQIKLQEMINKIATEANK